MGRGAPDITVILVAGDCRDRAQRVLDAVAAQEGDGVVEAVVVDLAGDGAGALRRPGGLRAHWLALPRETTWGEARVAGLRLAEAPIVAFLEDHCYPEPGWADALLRAYSDGWGAVGYAFVNANPGTYLARSAMLLDYGRWAHPARGGPSTDLPYNNVSYRRDVLLTVPDLERSLDSDFHVLAELRRRGVPMANAPDAIAAHENFVRIGPVMQSHFHYCRLLAARRVALGRWSRARRALYAAGTPLSGPAFFTARLVRSLRGRPGSGRPVLAALPVLAAKVSAAAAGEALGYVLGAGRSPQWMKHYEVHAERDMER